MCTPEIIDRMVRMQIIAVPQPSFIYELGDLSATSLRSSWPAPIPRTWFDRGIVAVGSSDVPVVDCDVLINLRSAVTRLTQTGQHMGPGQGVTIDEALRMFTINGAYASFEEESRARLPLGSWPTWLCFPAIHGPSKLKTCHRCQST